MEFPRHLHKPDGFYVVCETQEQFDPLMARGWGLEPAGHVENPQKVGISDALAEPAAEAEEAEPKKRGRKAKAE